MFRTLFLAHIAILLPLLASAGQSLVLNSSSNISVVDPVLPSSQSWRIEFQVHNWTPTPAGDYSAMLFDLLGTGSIARLSPGGILETETLDQVIEQQPCFVSVGGLTNALVRVQKNAAAMLFTCEVWNYDGTGYSSQVENISQLAAPHPYNGGTIGPGALAALGFLRVSTALLPLGAKPPTTADGGNWTELKFDGNLRDSSGNNHNASGSGVSYMATPNQVAVANPKTFGAPSWSNWVSLRAGYPAQLDGSASYSLADASSAVSCVWQQTDGPSSVIWTNQNAVTPTLNGLIFGTYDFSLQVTDVAGGTSSASLQVGAVATDDNGVVINADPNVDKIFGPMIAYGKNPWGYADERAMTATQLRIAAYNAQGLNPPSWDTALPGTVTYIFNGAGTAGAPAAMLSSAIPSASTTSIFVADASPLDLSSLPARILVGSGLPREEVRICGASAAKGPAALTVCYDGRGQSSPADSYRAAAQAWSAGAMVSQMKVTGSGTNFLSTICTAGPGPNGNSVYTAGSVRMTPGSTLVTGSSTSWSTADNVIATYLVRVSATHGGVPFVFSAYIASVADAAHLTLARPYPTDADAGAFSYSIIQADFTEISLHYTRPADGSDAQTYFQTSGCESDTAVYLYLGHDIASLDGSLQSSVQYSVMDGWGYTSAYGPNFYGEDLAHRALYYRSGWTPALQAARVFGDNYVSSPQVAGGDIGGIPLLIGGGVIGGFAAAILDTSDPNRPSWDTLRGLARNGEIAGLGCNLVDTRDSGYLGAWLTLAAEFDPDPAEQANWQTQLSRLMVRDQNCKGADNSWANGFLWNNYAVPLNMTNGSALVSGNDIPPGMCFGIASGTMTVINGSATGMGSGFAAGNKIVITGTMKGLPYTGFFQFNVNTDGTITMAALWPGDSGTATFVIENNDYLTTIATSNNDPQMTRNWACTWNSATQIALNRPWDGPTETGAYAYSYVLAGFGQQPFMLGVHITAMKFASQIADPAISTGYAALATEAAAWIQSTGYDPVTQGLFYGRIMQACEPLTVPPAGSTFSARTPGCNYGLNGASIDAARVLTAEAAQALRVYYESNPTEEAMAWGDRAYGSIWGYPEYTTGGVYSDSNYVRYENSNAALGAYKWTGFFFGMGMAHQWPAVRLGGVTPERKRRASLEVRQGAAAKTQISVTAPSGKVTVFACGPASPCEVTVDERQGSHWYRVQYLSAEGKVVCESDPALVGQPLPAGS